LDRFDEADATLAIAQEQADAVVNVSGQAHAHLVRGLLHVGRGALGAATHELDVARAIISEFGVRRADLSMLDRTRRQIAACCGAVHRPSSTYDKNDGDGARRTMLLVDPTGALVFVRDALASGDMDAAASVAEDLRRLSTANPAVASLAAADAHAHALVA